MWGFEVQSLGGITLLHIKGDGRPADLSRLDVGCPKGSAEVALITCSVCLGRMNCPVWVVDLIKEDVE